MLYGTFKFSSLASLHPCKGCTKGVHMVHKGCTHGAQRVYKGCTKGAQRVYKGCTHGAPRVYKAWTKGVQRVYKGCTKGVYIVRMSHKLKGIVTVSSLQTVFMIQYV